MLAEALPEPDGAQALVALAAPRPAGGRVAGGAA